MAMTKEELIETIDSTIVSNDVKGITAESLASILTEIVEAMGTGNGVGSEYIDMTMVDPANSDELTEEAKTHNAEVYAKLLDAMSVGAIPSICVNADGIVMFANDIMANLEEDGTIKSISVSLQMHVEIINVMFEVNDLLSEGEVRMFSHSAVLMIINLTSDGSIVISIPGVDV